MKKQIGVRTIEDIGLFCDGPLHVGDRYLQYSGITMHHGYNSEMDGLEQHFCGMKCLKDWIDTNPTAKSEYIRGATVCDPLSNW